jgi:hypothetical protein
MRAMAALCALLALAPGPARADRPLVSETADVIGAGDCQLETSLSRLSERGAPSSALADALVSCGLFGHTQLGVTLAGARSEGSTDMLLGLGGKTNLVPVGDGATGVALAYSIIADRRPGASWRHGGTRLYGVATRELAKGLVGHLNLGWLGTEPRGISRTTWAIGLEGDGPLRWAADAFGDDRTRPWLSGGVVLPIAGKTSANLAYAQQFGTPRQRLWTLGLKVEFF